MRVLSLSPFFESHGGGVEIVAGALARSLAAAGAESVWAACGSAPNIAGVRTIGLPFVDPLERSVGLPMPLPSPAAMARLFRSVRRADVVIAHDALYASTLAGRLAARTNGVPFVLVQHIGVLPFERRALRGVMNLADRCVSRPMLRGADEVVFISQTVADHFAPALRRPHSLVHNGVDHELFHPVEEDDRQPLRDRFARGDRRPLIAFAGRFVAKKGLATLEALARRMPDHLFAIAGGGPIDPACWNLENVRVLGRLERRDMANLFQASDALVLPSVGEGFPLVVQEAMACGLPVFCGAESARADRDASRFLHGIEIDITDPQDTAARFGDALRQAPLVPRREQAAYAAEAYNWSRNAERLLLIARQLQGSGVRSAEILASTP